MGFVGDQQWHGSIQTQAAVQVVGKDVQVVETIGFTISEQTFKVKLYNRITISEDTVIGQLINNQSEFNQS